MGIVRLARMTSETWGSDRLLRSCDVDTGEMSKSQDY